MSWDLILAVLVVAVPVVNSVSLLFLLPLQLSGKISFDANYFLWGGAPST